MKRYVLDENGIPREVSSVVEWAVFFEDVWARTIAYDEIGEATVSTVFLGYDLACDRGYGGQPRMWQTLIRGGPFDHESQRYRTRAEAEAGHRDAVALVRRPLCH